MKTRVGIIGLLVITTVTSFMVVYNHTSREAPPPPPPHPGGGVTMVKQTKTPTTGPPAVLRGYTSVVDQKPLQLRCDTCAVVSSSGQLTRGRRGREIDRAQCVIRMNDAPAGGRFQRQVGRRTTLRVVAHSSLKRLLRGRRELLDASPDAVLVFWGPSSAMRRDGRGAVFNGLRALKRLLPGLQMYVVTRGNMLSFDELFKKETGMDRKGSNSWLSTGWFTMGLATELCGSIDVYGMVPPDFCSSPAPQASVPYHYYEPWGRSECSTYLSHERSQQGGHHRFITEKAVFAGWARTHVIRFHQPDWTPRGPATEDNASNATESAGA